jgi:hypothetical protein
LACRHWGNISYDAAQAQEFVAGGKKGKGKEREEKDDDKHEEKEDKHEEKEDKHEEKEDKHEEKEDEHEEKGHEEGNEDDDVEVCCCETNLKHNTQKKTNFSYNEMLRSLSFMGSTPRLQQL